jgi:PAS fold.
MMNANWPTFIEGMLDAVWLVDPIDLRIIAANRPAAAMLGVEQDWLVGKPVIDLACTPEDMFFWEDVAIGLSNEIHSETLSIIRMVRCSMSSAG